MLLLKICTWEDILWCNIQLKPYFYSFHLKASIIQKYTVVDKNIIKQ